jgi:glycosyltransferase involved in cell wall biosynthesis
LNTRITIDYTPAHEQGGGIGRYVRELVASLAAIDNKTSYNLFVAGTTHASTTPISANFAWRTTRISPKWLARMWQRLKLPLPVETFIGSTDLFHATDFVLPPTRPHTRTLLTVHDLSFVRTPETAHPALKQYLDAVVPRSIKRATHILADSQATKDDIVDLYSCKPDRISVLLGGVDAHFKPSDLTPPIRARYSIPDKPYVFSVGTVQPRKNYSRLIQAIARLREQGTDIDLVISGGHGWLQEGIHETVRATKMTDHVHFTGFVDDSDLPALYSGAECMAFPSLYEGFGLPVLESMACGTPVLTSNISSLPEVAGDAAVMVDPLDTEAIAHGLSTLLDDTDLRTKLIERGYLQKSRFTWRRAATQLKDIYTHILQI